MPVNRQTKRLMQRQGQMGPDGGAPVDKRRPQQAAARPPKGERTSPIEFLREVRGELRRVAWPSRGEVANYSAIVLLTLVVLIALIFALDFVFAKAVLFLFDT
jgi:preprotein translocase subunit SecE